MAAGGNNVNNNNNNNNDNWTWLNPRGPNRQISATIQDVTIEKKNNTNNRYEINIPKISISTYWELVHSLRTMCRNKNNNNNNDHHYHQWRYLKLNKNNNNIRKNIVRNVIIFALSICPACHTSNCAFSCASNKKKNNKKNILKKKFIQCSDCRRIFKTRYHTVNHTNYKTQPFSKCIHWPCKQCKDTFQGVYSEFLLYLIQMNKKKTNDDDHDDKKSLSYHHIQHLFKNLLSDGARKELNYDVRTLYYTLNVQTESDSLIIIPPLAFIGEMNKQVTFYENLLLDTEEMRLDVKTKYGSANSRARGGKNSFFRSCGLNKRYVLSARVIIVPNKQLEPHECILPKDLYRRLNCPKVIAGHRYPTLDVRSVTYHRVVATWEYPCLGISTAIVTGNNADFDGDCLHIIPVTNLQSRAELEYLGNPQYNMIVQNQLRVKFDHDEVQTIYSQFGIDGHQIHAALLEYARKTSSPEAYNIFCQLRRYCHWVWEYYSCVPTISFQDFLEIHRKCQNEKKINYQAFVTSVYPTIAPENGIKELILSRSSRFSIDHLWQIFGEINKDANMGFLQGMDKLAFIKMALISREAIIKDVAYYGYAHIKLTHCTKTIVVGYDGKLYTTDGVLVGIDTHQFYGQRKK